MACETSFDSSNLSEPDYIQYKGRRLSTKVPYLEALEKIKSLSFTDHCLYLLCSPLIGHGIPEVLKILPKNSVLCLVEFEPTLCKLLSPQISSLHSEALFIPESFQKLSKTNSETLSPYEYAEELSRYFSKGIRYVQILGFFGGRRFHSEKYQTLEQNLQELLQLYWRNQSTSLFMSHLWMRNLFLNLSQEPEQSKLPRLNEQEVIVLGAGPSLDSVLSQLKPLRQKFVLMAVDTALPSLLAHGITPDFLVVLEAQQENVKDFIENNPEDLHLICDISAYTSFLHTRTMRKITWICSRHSEVQLWERLAEAQCTLPLVPPLGSVGILALYLLKMMQAKTAYLAGLDFSFKPGRSHSKLSASHRNYLSRNSRLNPLFAAGLGGKDTILEFEEALEKTKESNYTNPVMKSYAQDAQILLKNLAPHTSCFDLRSSGINLGLASASLEALAQTHANVQSPETTPPISEESTAESLFLGNNSGKSFLEKLLSDCEALLERLDTLGFDPKTTEKALKETEVQKKLQELDFLLLAIPAHRRNDPESLILIRLEIWYFKHFIEKLLG